MKTLIFSLSDTGLEQYTSPLWKKYCSKHDIDYMVSVGISFNYSDKYKNISKFLDFYDKVCYVDVDTIPLPEADNIFDYCTEPLNLCRDYSNIGWIISNLKDNDCTMKWWDYMNTGLIVADKEAKITIDSFIVYLEEKCPVGLDQTLFNKYIYDYGIKVNYLTPDWNVTHLDRKGLYQFDNFLEAGKILHFNEENKEQRLLDTYERLI
jgi:hypothetical protein